MWLSRDPLENSELLQWPNLYAYGPNDPVNGFDKDGQIWWGFSGAAGAALDLSLQLYMNDWEFDCVNWGDVSVSFATSAAGYGLLNSVSKVNKGLKAKRTLDRLSMKKVPEKTWSNYAKGQKKEALNNKNNINKVAGAVSTSQVIKNISSPEHNKGCK